MKETREKAPGVGGGHVYYKTRFVFLAAHSCHGRSPVSQQEFRRLTENKSWCIEALPERDMGGSFFRVFLRRWAAATPELPLLSFAEKSLA